MLYKPNFIFSSNSLFAFLTLRWGPTPNDLPALAPFARAVLIGTSGRLVNGDSVDYRIQTACKNAWELPAFSVC